MDEFADRAVEALVTVAAAVADHPTDRQLLALLVRTIVDADRCLRLREAYERQFPPA